MMSVVAQENDMVVLQLKVEASVYSFELRHSCFYFFGCSSSYLCQGHSCDAVFYVDIYWHTQLHVFDIS